MLSQNLQTLADHLRPYAERGLIMESAAVTTICAIVEAAIEDAEELEARAIPVLDQRIGDLPDNVVRLAKKLDGKGVYVGPRLCTPEPEGAA